MKILNFNNHYRNNYKMIGLTLNRQFKFLDKFNVFFASFKQLYFNIDSYPNVIVKLTDKFEIFGIIYSLILLAGFYQIGDLIFKIKNIKIIFNQISDVKYQKIFLSINLILLIFYPLILYLDKNKLYTYIKRFITYFRNF